MATLGIHHVNVLVDDLDAARRFYTGVMGFVEAARPDFGFPGAWFQMGAQQLHLTPSDVPERKSAQHFALQVSDLDTLCRDLEAKGARIDRVPYTPGAGHQAFLADPAGNLIELNQPDPQVGR